MFFRLIERLLGRKKRLLGSRERPEDYEVRTLKEDLESSEVLGRVYRDEEMGTFFAVLEVYKTTEDGKERRFMTVGNIYTMSKQYGIPMDSRLDAIRSPLFHKVTSDEFSESKTKMSDKRAERIPA